MFFDEHGCSPYMTGECTEIDERKRSEEQQRLQLNVIETIAQNVTAALFMMDANRCCTYMVPRRSERLLACPDLLLSDVLMPQMNGVELAIAVQEKCPRTRVMLFSGQAATADLRKRAGDLRHQFELLPKPLHPEQLLEHCGADSFSSANCGSDTARRTGPCRKRSSIEASRLTMGLASRPIHHGRMSGRLWRINRRLSYSEGHSSTCFNVLSTAHEGLHRSKFRTPRRTLASRSP
jgi:CheY-like chemotaxis protein